MSDRSALSVSAWALILGAVGILLLPLPWLVSAAFAACFHEACHLMALRLLNGRLMGIRIGGHGAVIRAGELSAPRELICLLAGPVGSLSLLLFARYIPRAAVCALLQSAYNLLPLYPLDGGRALRCIARLTLPPDRADRFCAVAENVCRGVIVICLGYLTVKFGLGMLPVLAGILILLGSRKEILLAKLRL